MNNKNLYPENWTDEIRPRILARDKFKCTSCGIKHRQHIFIDQNNKVIRITGVECRELSEQGMRAYKVYLQVCHKNNIKSDCSDENLIAKCPRCHYLLDKEYKRLLRIGNP